MLTPSGKVPQSTFSLPSRGRFWGALGGATAILAVAAWAAPHLPPWPIPAYLFAFTGVSGAALAVAWHTPCPGPRVPLAIPLAAGGLLAVHLTGADGLPAALAVTACLLAGGTALGTLVGARIEHPGHLLFVVPVSALADVVSVQHPSGVSHAIIESERALSLLALSFPMLGTTAIEPLLGVGDVVFLAFYLAAARVHQLSVCRTAVSLAAALAATAGLVILLETAIPALPVLGVAMLIAHPEARRPRPAERRTGLIGLGLLSLVAAWLLFR